MSHFHWPKRLYSLDATRGIAALSVVLWHWQHFAFNGSTPPLDFDSTSQPLYIPLKIFYERGDWAVQYFFLLSGFIFFWLYASAIAKKEISFARFWIQRMSRLYPLHLITLIVVALLQAVYIAQNGSSFVYAYNDAYHFILNLGLISQWSLSTELSFSEGYSFNGPIWTVSLEILLYLIFFITAYIRQGKVLFCLGISAISFTILQLTYDRYNSILLGLAFFFLGGVLFQATVLLSTKLQRLRPLVYSISLLSWGIVIVSFYLYDLKSLALNYGFLGDFTVRTFPFYILLPFTVCSLVLIEIENPSFWRPMAWLGDIAYSCYLLHFPLQLLFELAVSYGFLSADFYLNPGCLFLFLSLLIPLSYITYTRFERPMQRIIRAQLNHRLSQRKRLLRGQ